MNLIRQAILTMLYLAQDKQCLFDSLPVPVYRLPLRSPALVTLTRGNGAMVSFLDNGSGTFIAQTPAVLNGLVKDTPNGLWKETALDCQGQSNTGSAQNFDRVFAPKPKLFG
jgi:hypothetical protein